MPKRAPNIVNRKVTRKPYKDIRAREYLKPDEVEKLMESASEFGRHGHRDKTLILIAYRHALRVSELISLRWDMVDLKKGLLHVTRLKNGIDSVHPLRGPELRALRKLLREYPDTPYLWRMKVDGTNLAQLTDINAYGMDWWVDVPAVLATEEERHMTQGARPVDPGGSS